MKIGGVTALVTGASSGVGEATAKTLAKRGARHVLLLARTQEDLKRVAGEIAAEGGSVAEGGVVQPRATVASKRFTRI